MGNISSVSRDPGRIQARPRLAGEMPSRVNTYDVLRGKAIAWFSLKRNSSPIIVLENRRSSPML